MVFSGVFADLFGGIRRLARGAAPQADYFLCAAKESRQRNAAPVRHPLRGCPALLGSPGLRVNSHEPHDVRPRARTYASDTSCPASVCCWGFSPLQPRRTPCGCCATRWRTGGRALCSIKQSCIAGLHLPLCAVPTIGCRRAEVWASIVRASSGGAARASCAAPARMGPSKGPRSGGAPGAPSLGYLSWQDKKGNLLPATPATSNAHRGTHHVSQRDPREIRNKRAIP